MAETSTPGERLAAWRAAHDPKITLQFCAGKVGVKHPTWIDWEKGSRSPSLEKALAIELFTEGAIEIESWGFDEETMARLTAVLRQRGIAGRKAKRAAAQRVACEEPLATDPTDPALDEGRPSMAGAA